MRQNSKIAVGVVLALFMTVSAIADTGQVVLLHGLARSAGSMHSMAETIGKAGFSVCNINYPSRHHPIATLTEDFVVPEIQHCFPAGKVNFVTHSLGGIIVRQLAKTNAVEMGRVVMLSPPNQGSEVVDKLGSFGLFNWINGPTGQQLGTNAESLPNQLGPADFSLGIITGNRTINWFLSSLIPGADDGKVAVERAKLTGMTDFLVVKQTHPFIMLSDEVQTQTLHFLRNGIFAKASD